MVISTSPLARRAADPLQLTVLRAELAALIEGLTGRDGPHATALPRLTLTRVSHTQHPVHTHYEPALCVLAQGCKRVHLGGEVHVYDSSHHLVVAQHLPVTGQVVDASPEAPYLGLRLQFDVNEIAALALELDPALLGARRGAARGLYTAPVNSALLEPVLRLVRLLQTPQDLRALAPLVTREILYRLLTAPEGWRVAQMALADSHTQRIGQAIGLLRQRFAEPLRVEALADAVHMSVSSLHHHFKAATAMSPLQFQKELRLQEARRMMLAEQLDAATAGHRVGYESQSQFNREYSRFFGAPPARDIKQLREQQLGR
ncbi:AraC family transcriptional regulator N-terminal domain-containing protein [Aquabacterium sp.]|uniref:AraC family transcriptional regulator n=1 Tax=Aquabacterium sp. TaxID=1872578 RepID=UPI0037841DEB